MRNNYSSLLIGPTVSVCWWVSWSQLCPLCDFSDFSTCQRHLLLMFPAWFFFFISFCNLVTYESGCQKCPEGQFHQSEHSSQIVQEIHTYIYYTRKYNIDNKGFHLRKISICKISKWIIILLWNRCLLSLKIHFCLLMRIWPTQLAASNYFQGSMSNRKVVRRSKVFLRPSAPIHPDINYNFC